MKPCIIAELSFFLMMSAMFEFEVRAYLFSKNGSHETFHSTGRKSVLHYADSAFEDLDIRELYPPPSSSFENTNVVIHAMGSPNPKVWESTLPGKDGNFWTRLISLGEDEKHLTKGIDVSVIFSDPYEGAMALVEECFNSTNFDGVSESDETTVKFIQEVFQWFRSVASSSSELSDEALFKARVVSSRGPGGQKCPRWHVDHVPLRLVMSLLGPGCMYIPHETENRSKEVILNRTALNSLDEEDTDAANNIILPRGEEGVVTKACAGDSVILMGRAWERGSILAAPHCSPPLDVEEGRVLLTIDMIPNSIQS